MEEIFKNARKETKKFIDQRHIEHHMFYSPISNLFWEQEIKVLIINEEPYGYEKCKIFDVGKKTLCDWLNDKGNTRTRTVRYSLAFAKVVLDCLEKGKEPTRKDLKEAYNNIKSIENDTLNKITYYNIRPTSNSTKRENYTAIIDSGKSCLGKKIYAEIQALEADIIIIGGKAGCNSFNAMSGDNILKYKQSTNLNKSIIHSIKHPSIPNYNQYLEAIKNICEMWKKH